ncbi:hypothetical protein bas08_0038 [Escherichia phage DanielBernoulli]|uniref:Phage protein n=1 Tax=Escherichia phage DanielBernoulli TaxID=2851972 RepID=A0AAE8AXS6_9CAUD|nr:hypothetical protein bas08_0038 [Escherichia phage DanielBernoulli]
MEKIETIVENGVEYRRVELTERGLWLLYRAMVCEAIEKAKETETVGSDLWMFTGALDMSFDETKELVLSKWEEKINQDLKEFLADPNK